MLQNVLLEIVLYMCEECDKCGTLDCLTYAM